MPATELNFQFSYGQLQPAYVAIFGCCSAQNGELCSV